MATLVSIPFEQYTDIDGSPLLGSMRIGIAGLDPVTNPLSAYWNKALTTAAAQPISIIGGYPMYLGSPGNLYVAASDYSIAIYNAAGQTVYTSLNTKIPSVTETTVSIMDYGAVGDGVTDDSTAVTTCINDVDDFTTVLFPSNKSFLLASRVIVNKPLTIMAYGATIKFPNGRGVGGYSEDAFTVTSSDVHIRGGIWTEVAPSVAPPTGGYGVVFLGTQNGSGVAPTYIERVSMVDAYFKNWEYVALSFVRCKNYIANRNMIENVGYSGITVLSSHDGIVDGNIVDGVNLLGSVGDNSYGIIFTAPTNGNTVQIPLSSGFICTNNVVKNVRFWEGIDSHGGSNYTVSNNYVYNCATPIAMVSYPGATAPYDQGSSHGTISGNIIDCDPTVIARADRKRGIIVEGTVLAGGSTGQQVSIVGNSISNYGGYNATETMCGIEIQTINDAVISGNSIYNAGSAGIGLWSAVNVLVDGNNIWGIEPDNTVAEYPTITATFSGQPAPGDTLTVYNVVCTFGAGASAVNSNTAVAVQIGGDLDTTLGNLMTILTTARGTGSAAVAPNGVLTYIVISRTTDSITFRYAYPTRMLASSYAISKSSANISLPDTHLSIPADVAGAGIFVKTLSGGDPCSGMISNNFIRNPNASGYAIRGICQFADAVELRYVNNTLSGEGCLYDIEGSAVWTCDSATPAHSSKLTYNLPSIASGATFEFNLPMPFSQSGYMSVHNFGHTRYLNGIVYSFQPATSHVKIQLYNTTGGAVDLASIDFVMTVSKESQSQYLFGEGSY